MTEDSLRQVPNFFYDIIVFVTPTLILVAGSWLGIHGLDTSNIRVVNLDLSGTVWLVLAGLFLSYEYGRFAEAWSAQTVQKPMQWARHLRMFRSPDFLAAPPAAYDTLGLDVGPTQRDGGKWVIYMFAYVAHPAIGSDLLKRYAWEKLSRSSAFTYALLFVASCAVWGLKQLGVWREAVSHLHGFGSAWLTGALFVLAIATGTEYYRRNCWNYDLLLKVSPVLVEARRIIRERDDKSLDIKVDLALSRISRRPSPRRHGETI